MSTLAKITKDLFRLNEDGAGLDRVVFEAESAVGVGRSACDAIEHEIRLRSQGSQEAQAYAAIAQKSLTAARHSLEDANRALVQVGVGRQKGSKAIADWLAEHGAGASGGGSGAVGRERLGEKAGEVAKAAGELVDATGELAGATNELVRAALELVPTSRELSDSATEVREKIAAATPKVQETFDRARKICGESVAAFVASWLLERVQLKPALEFLGEALETWGLPIIIGAVGINGGAVALILIALGKPFIETVVSKFIEGLLKQNVDRSMWHRQIGSVTRQLVSGAARSLVEEAEEFLSGTWHERGVIAGDWATSIALSLAEDLLKQGAGAVLGEPAAKFVSPVLAALAAGVVWRIKNPPGPTERSTTTE